MQDSILNGRYRLGQTIGEGGMAVVYHGRDLLLNREVAIKVLRDHYAADEAFLERFKREGQIAAGMTHPNIVSVYDVGADGSRHYIVMEFIRGPNLKELIYRQGPFSVDGAVFIIGQVASALDYAHQRGLVHRDIKPQNILVDREGNAKVVDFGIAKGFRDPSLTETGTGMGTVHYVSPEQARGAEIGPASDLYSTGVVLFEMLTRELPFDADTPVAIAMKHVSERPPRPSSINAHVPPEIDEIVLKALAKDPMNRFPSGAALEAALRFWDDPRLSPRPATVAATAASARARAAQAPPRAAGRRPPPSAARQRAARRQPTGGQRRASRNEVGCATWIIGILLLVTIVAIVLAVMQWGPELFESGPARTGAPTTSLSDQGGGIVTGERETPTPESAVAETPTTPPEPETRPTATPASGDVPELRNTRISDARIAVAGRWDLDAEEEFHPSVTTGLIIRQEPDPGTNLPLGETVRVWVSAGPAIVELPDIAGLPEEKAIDELNALGLRVEIEEEPSQEFAAGRAVRTEPEVQANASEPVTLYISLGDVVRIPDLFGTNLFAARNSLLSTGLNVGNIVPRTCEYLEQANEAFDCNDVRPNDVVAISSGTELLTWGDIVDRGTTIDIVYLQETRSP